MSTGSGGDDTPTTLIGARFEDIFGPEDDTASLAPPGEPAPALPRFGEPPFGKPHVWERGKTIPYGNLEDIFGDLGPVSGPVSGPFPGPFPGPEHAPPAGHPDFGPPLAPPQPVRPRLSPVPDDWGRPAPPGGPAEFRAPSPDGGMPGAGQPDAGPPDSGQPDSGQPGASATQLELEPRAANSYIARVLDTGLFYETTFVLEVESSRPAALIEQQFPLLCKIGPVTRMADIVASNLPGFVLTHVPTPPPPRQLRAIPRSVYFVVEKDQPAWADRGERPAIGVHFAGDWPDLRLTLWATMETET